MAKKKSEPAVIDLTGDEDVESREHPPEGGEQEKKDAPVDKKKKKGEGVKTSDLGTKATITDGVYKLGSVAFGIDPDSLPRSMEMVDKLPRATLEQVVVLHGEEEVPDDVSDSQLMTYAKSLVQNDWYLLLKGEIPLTTKNNHETRKKNFKDPKKRTVKKTAGGGESKPRAMASYRLSAEGKKFHDKMKDGQQKLVYDAIAKQGETNTTQVTAAVVKTGKLTTKQEPVKVVGFYVSQGKSKGLIVGA